MEIFVFYLFSFFFLLLNTAGKMYQYSVINEKYEFLHRCLCSGRLRSSLRSVSKAIKMESAKRRSKVCKIIL